MSVLIDTCIFVALSNSRDVNHNRAKELVMECMEHRYGRPFLSDYIFDEILTTAFVRTKNHKKSVELGEYILGSEIELISIDEQCFQQAWEIYQKNKLSFTDCSSLALMKLYGINNLLTFDGDLEKAAGIKKNVKTPKA